MGNVADSFLPGGCTNVATDLTVEDGDGPLFALVAGSRNRWALLYDAASPGVFETVLVKVVAGDVLTVARGQRGTTALAWDPGARMLSGAFPEDVDGILAILQGELRTPASLVPPGGDTGKVLKKSSGDDYATEWGDGGTGGGDMNGAASSVADDIVTFADTTGKQAKDSGTRIADLMPASYLDTDGTLAANSDVKVASQKAIVTYVGARIAGAGVATIRGSLDCHLDPDYPVGVAGDFYVVSVGGKIGGSSGAEVIVGDWVWCFISNGGGSQAAVGDHWDIIQVAITLAGLGGVAANAPITGGTHTKLTYDAKGLVTNGADATTADIADSTGKRYTPEPVAPSAGNLSVLGIANGETVRADKLLLDTTAPSAQRFADAAAAGTSAKAARADHVHAMMAAPTASSVGASPAAHAHHWTHTDESAAWDTQGEWQGGTGVNTDTTTVPGSVVLTSYNATGTQTMRRDATYPGTTWNSVAWTGSTPAGTVIKARLRAADTTAELDAGTAAWSAWVTVSGTPLTGQGTGRYSDTQFQLESSGTNTPQLDLGSVSATYHTGDAGALQGTDLLYAMIGTETVPAARILGHKEVTAGPVEPLTAPEVRTLINVADGANAYVHPNHSGDVTSAGDGAQTIAAGAVTLAKQANIATGSIMGRFTAGTGVQEVLTPANAKSVLSLGNVTNNLQATQVDGSSLGVGYLVNTCLRLATDKSKIITCTPFACTTGTAMNDYGKNGHGPTLSSDASNFTPGYTTYGLLRKLTFPGSTSEISWGDNAAYSPTTGFTINVACKPTNFVSRVMLGKANLQTGLVQLEFMFWWDGSGKLRLTIYNATNVSQFISMGSDSAYSGDSAVTHHYGGIWNGGGTTAALSLYRDGVQIAATGSGSGFTAMADTTAPMGCYYKDAGNNPTAAFIGDMVFNSFLSEVWTADQEREFGYAVQAAAGRNFA